MTPIRDDDRKFTDDQIENNVPMASQQLYSVLFRHLHL